ncbi:MAG TPA: hypothetical protein VFU64_01890 [Gaiellaceae bacterium]|nr:hypothetical protein [Gaiellaceae bacterium]
MLTRGQAVDAVIPERQSPIQASDVLSIAQAMTNHLDAGVAG